MANRDQAMEVLQQVNLVLCRKADEFTRWAPTSTRGPRPWRIIRLLSHSQNRDRLVFTDKVVASHRRAGR